MAQDITLQGNQYQDVPWVDLPKTGGGYARFIDMSEMADYVVEQGTSGIWTWRVWNSGIAECWGETSTDSYTSWTLWNNHVYYTSSTIGGDAYPSGFFDGNSSVHCSMDFIPTVNDVWLGYHRDGDNRFTPTAYLYKATNASASGFIRYYARGKVSSGWSA